MKLIQFHDQAWASVMLEGDGAWYRIEGYRTYASYASLFITTFDHFPEDWGQECNKSTTLLQELEFIENWFETAMRDPMTFMALIVLS